MKTAKVYLVFATEDDNPKPYLVGAYATRRAAEHDIARRALVGQPLADVELGKAKVQR